MTADKIRALMSVDPSQPLNLLRLARAGEKFEGVVGIDKMERLTDLLLSPSAELGYCLSFDIEDSGQIRIKVSIESTLDMVCQRCLQPMPVKIARESWLAIVANKTEMESLPSELEPLLLVENEELTLNGLLEDELLLAIPLAPLHPETKCGASAELEKINAEGKINPFAVLADLKRND